MYAGGKIISKVGVGKSKCTTNYSPAVRIRINYPLFRGEDLMSTLKAYRINIPEHTNWVSLYLKIVRVQNSVKKFGS